MLRHGSLFLLSKLLLSIFTFTRKLLLISFEIFLFKRISLNNLAVFFLANDFDGNTCVFDFNLVILDLVTFTNFFFLPSTTFNNNNTTYNKQAYNS